MYYVNVTDWEGIKGSYEVVNIHGKVIEGIVKVSFINSVGDVETMLVHRSSLFEKEVE